MKDKKYWLGFSVFNGVGPKRFKLLYDYFGSSKKIWQAKRETLLATGLSARVVNDFIKFRQKFNPDFYSRWLTKRSIKFLTLRDASYPKNLKQIDDPPFVLYFQGKIKKSDNLALGVVGTRRPTIYGREVTENLVADLVGCGLTIVSGMARGIDSIAHKTAIKYGGRTMAVFACGVDIIYPPENKNLSEEIINHGAIVSEFPPGTKPSLGSFPYRNRVISGLSLGVLVTEGAVRSGSLITARKAGEQGREVFAVPGPITSRMSGATAKLLKDGAKLVGNVADILEELKIETRAQRLEVGKGSNKISKEEQLLLEILKDGALHIDEIVRRTKMKTGQVCSLLTMMEIKGKVKNLGGMTYSLKH
jgi:DNA processing protein